MRRLAGTCAALLLLGAAPAAGEEDGLQPVWSRFGTGFVKDLAVADLTGGGAGEVVVGGRGVQAIGAASVDSGVPLWVNKWDGWPTVPGDGQSVREFELADLTGDGAPGLVVAAHQRAVAIDGGTGATLWVTDDENLGGGSPGAWEVATADWNGDGVPDVVFAGLVDDRLTAVDGRDGSLLWSSPREGVYLDLRTADLNLDGAPDVVAVGYVDAGFEVQAFSGLLAADTGTALPMWVQRFPPHPPDPPSGPIFGLGGDPTVVAVGQVLPDPTPNVVVADASGNVGVLHGPTGALTGLWDHGGAVTDLVLADLDGDGLLEIVVASSTVDDDGPVGVAAYDGLGTRLWSVRTPAPVWDLAAGDLDGDGQSAVLVGGGWRTFGGQEELDGFGLAIDGGGETLWERRLPERVEAVAIGAAFGDARALLGQTHEGGVVGLAADGEERWAYRTGGRVEDLAAADLDGDGVLEVIEGADDSVVAVHDADGRLRWWARVPGKGGPDVTRVAAGDLTPAEGLEVVAGTWEFARPGPGGRLHTYSAEGELVWSRDLVGSVDGLAVADLDGDGSMNVVAVTSVQGSVGRYDGDGAVVWEQAINTRTHGTLTLRDVTGDGRLEVLVSSKGLFDGEVYALDGRTGEELWRYTNNTGFNWVDAGPEGIVAGDLAGRVDRLDPVTGQRVWRVQPGGSSWDGGWTADVTGDGVPDVLSVSEDSNVRLLSGADGSEVWTAPLDERGFRVTTVQGSRGPTVVAGSYGAGPIWPAAIYAIDLVTGERLGTHPAENMVLSLLAADLDGDGVEVALAAAGWQIHALRP